VTDLSSTDMLRLGMMFKDATDKDVTTVAFPGIPNMWMVRRSRIRREHPSP